MINVINNEKVKETKTTSEEDSFKDFEDEAMENAEESFEMEEMSSSEISVPYDSGKAPGSVSLFKSDVLEEQSVIINNEERKRRILKEKYLNAVGRRPKFVPYIKIYPDEEEEEEEEEYRSKSLFFGERRAYVVDKKRKEKWQEKIKKNQPVKFNPGRVLRDIMLPPLNGGVLSVRFEKNGGSVAMSYRDGGLEVRSVFTGEPLARLVTVEKKDRLPVRAVRYHPIEENKIYAGGAAGIVQVFDLETYANIGNSGNINQMCNLDLSFDGNNLVTTGRASKITVIDPSTLEVKSVKERPNIDEYTQGNIDDEYHKLRIYALKCHPDDPNVFVTGGWDSTVKIWDFRVFKAIRSIRGPWINGDGLDIFENQILTASWRPENSIKIYDFFSGNLIKEISVVPKTTPFEGEFLYNAKFFKDTFKNINVRGLIAVAGNGFHEVSVLNINTKEVVAFFPSHKAVACVDTLGNMIAYGGTESLFRIGELTLYEKSRQRHHRIRAY